MLNEFDREEIAEAVRVACEAAADARGADIDAGACGTQWDFENAREKMVTAMEAQEEAVAIIEKRIARIVNRRNFSKSM